jgi:hypothetical protein
MRPHGERTHSNTPAWLSSCVVPIQPAALEVLSDLAPVLRGWGRWFVFGAQAVIAYGVPRLSADVDITLAMVPDDPATFVGDMEAHGFSALVRYADFVRRTRVIPYVHVATGMPVDVVLAGSACVRIDRAERESRVRPRQRPTSNSYPSGPTSSLPDLMKNRLDGAMSRAPWNRTVLVFSPRS